MRQNRSHFTIGEVADKVGVKEHVLRFWETQFDFLKPIKNNAGHRKYYDKDINLIKKIKYLVHDQKFTIAGARKKLLENKDKLFDEFNENDFSADLTQSINLTGIDTTKSNKKNLTEAIKTMSDIIDKSMGKNPELTKKASIDSDYVIPVSKTFVIEELKAILKLL